MAKVVAPKFSAEQEQALRNAPLLNNEIASAFAAEWGKSPASVRAKIVRMNLPYQRKVATAKNGAPVERKEAIVAEIAQLVEGNLDGLEKAPKLALQLVRDHLRAVGE